jgi:hypothetical protein
MSSEVMYKNENNDWPTYKYYAETYAAGIGAELIIIGREEAPIIGSANYDSKLLAYNEKCRKMFYYLRASQTPQTRLHLQNVETNDARGAWKALCDYYESSSNASIMQQMSRLVSLKQTDSVPMFVDELTRVRGLLDAAVKEKKLDLMDVICSTVLLGGLKPEFGPIRTILQMDDKLKFEDCKAKVLLSAERVRIEEEGISLSLTNSLAFRTQSNNNTTGKESSRPKCTTCGKLGHTKDRCFTTHPELRPAPRHAKKAVDAEENDSSCSSSHAWFVQVLHAHSVKETISSNKDVITFDIDSGASDHFVNTLQGVSNFSADTSVEVELANGMTVSTAGVGMISERLPKVNYAPSFSQPLLSVAKLVDDGKAILFHPSRGVVLMDANNHDKVLAEGYRTGDVFKLDVRIPSTLNNVNKASSKANTEVNKASSKANTEEWTEVKRKSVKQKIVLLHNRSDHPAAGRMFHSYHHARVNGTCLPVGLKLQDFKDAVDNCDACKQAKSKESPHFARKGPRKALKPFEKIAVDIKGPLETKAIGGERFILQIVDLGTDDHYSFPLKSKSDELDALRRFEGQVVRANGFNIRSIRWDNSGEQRSSEIDSWLTSSGIRSEPTGAYSSAMNGAAERAIQTDSSVAKALRLAANFPKNLFAELHKTASFLHQFSPSRINDDDPQAGKTPYERRTGKKPDISFLRRIGCTAYVHVHKPKRKALDANATKGRLIGYTMYPKGYRVLLPNNKIVNSPHVTFNETQSDDVAFLTAPGYYDANGPTDEELSLWRSDNLDEVSTTSVQPRYSPAVVDPAVDENEVNEITYEQLLIPELAATVPTRSNQRRSSQMSVDSLQSLSGALRANANRVCVVKKIPFKSALQDERLKTSMVAELNNLFTGSDPPASIVDLPPGRRAIDSTWAHKFKFTSTGEFDRAKSRICPFGYQEIPGLDYDPSRVASPVITLGCFFLFLSIAVQRKMTRRVVDIDAAFTIPILENEIYMKFPKGMTPIHGKAIRLNHSLNGLKQGSHDWFILARKHLVDDGFKQSQVEPCLFFKWDENKELTMVAVYVDDFDIASDNPETLEKVISNFKKSFPCKVHSGDLYLGMSFTSHENGDVDIHQESSIDSLLTLLGLEDCAPVSTPAVPNRRLIRTTVQDETVKDFPYRSAVGILLWLARCSRPDIFFAVNQLSAHVSCFSTEHVKALKHCARYLKGTRSLRLLFRAGAPNILLRAYADADFAGEPQENDKPMHSLSGSLLYMVGTGPIFWQSKLQPTISRSTAEAEYRASGSTTQHIASYRNLLHELGFVQTSPTVLYEDNQACISMTTSHLCSSKSRHIKLDHHYIREQVRDGEVALEYCPTSDMLADIFTKALPKPQFQRLRDLLMNGGL